MKKTVVKIAMLAAYCVPFPFLAVWGDGMYGTVLMYGIMIAAYSVLGILCRRTKNEIVMMIGGIAGGVLSLAAVKLSGLQSMDHYFKPFTAFGLTAALSAAEFAVNALIAGISMRRSRAC